MSKIVDLQKALLETTFPKLKWKYEDRPKIWKSHDNKNISITFQKYRLHKNLDYQWHCVAYINYCNDYERISTKKETFESSVRSIKYKLIRLRNILNESI